MFKQSNSASNCKYSTLDCSCFRERADCIWCTESRGHVTIIDLLFHCIDIPTASFLKLKYDHYKLAVLSFEWLDNNKLLELVGQFAIRSF